MTREQGQHEALHRGHVAVRAEALAVADARGARRREERRRAVLRAQEHPRHEHRTEARTEAVFIDADVVTGARG